MTRYDSQDEARYHAVFDAWGESPTLVGIWREVYGADYPEEAEPFGFVTVFDLKMISMELEIGPGQRLLDIGCGGGGPGLWVARQLRTRLIGIDLLEPAIDQARLLSDKFGLGVQADFKVGSFTEIPLPVASVDAAMSVDAFWMVVDKKAALEEMARVLTPGSRFVLTTWSLPSLAESPMWDESGFEVLTCEETPRWQERQLQIYQLIRERRAELVEELGEASTILVSEAQTAPALLAEAPRVLIIAERM